jgi:squalene cyclase
MSDYFIADGDITSTATAVLHAAGRRVDPTRLHRFQDDGHYSTYAGELQSSLTTTAHAVLALGLAGHDVDTPCRFLIAHQDADGRWRGDKWHSSWLYTTATIVAALGHAGKLNPLPATREAILSTQNDDGGWSITPRSTTSETAYALHILLMLDRAGLLDDPARAARDRGYRWLQNHYRPAKSETVSDRLWIGKELYTPVRVDRANELSALLAIALADNEK